MVQRSELLAAVLEANANKDEAALKEKDLQWHREQLCKAREQLHEAQQEAVQLHISMGHMVQKSALDELKEAADSHQDAAKDLRGDLRSLQNEKAALEQLLQVCLQ